MQRFFVREKIVRFHCIVTGSKIISYFSAIIVSPSILLEKLNSSVYDKRMTPQDVLNSSDPTDVYIDIYVESISSLHESDMVGKDYLVLAQKFPIQ